MNKPFTRAAHLRDNMPEEEAPNAALLIDFDNVTMAMRSNLALELRKLLDSDIIRGKVAIQRAYADWRRYPQYIVPLSEASIDLIFAPAYGSSKKNATDIRLAVDALEIVFTRPEIGTYILLSGDSDFSSLVLKLKEYGKYVIGVGLQESSSDILVQNCDEYYSYTSLSGLTSATDMPRERYDPWELAKRALAKMVERGDTMRSDRLKQVMLELDTSFDEKAVGFSKFNRFLTEASSRQIIQLRKGQNGQYEVGLPKSSPQEGAADATYRPVASGASREADRSGASQAAGRPAATKGKGQGRRTVSQKPTTRPPSHTTGERTGPVESVGDGDAPPDVTAAALLQAYQILVEAVKILYVAGQPVRDSQVKRKLLVMEGDFDEAALGFRKFSRFLQQAHDEGVVDLIQGDDGNYFVSPVDGSPVSALAEPKERGTPQHSEDEGRRPRAGGRDRPRKEPEGRKTAASDRPRGLGLFRRGSRGRRPAPPTGPNLSIGSVEPSREASETPPERAQKRVDAVKSGDQLSGEEAIQHMVQHYAGVGRRTASRLVEVFGDRVFEVIDREPSRISELLSERRARAVIEARKAERE